MSLILYRLATIIIVSVTPRMTPRLAPVVAPNAYGLLSRVEMRFIPKSAGIIAALLTDTA